MMFSFLISLNRINQSWTKPVQVIAVVPLQLNSFCSFMVLEFLTLKVMSLHIHQQPQFHLGVVTVTQVEKRGLTFWATVLNQSLYLLPAKLMWICKGDRKGLVGVHITTKHFTFMEKLIQDIFDQCRKGNTGIEKEDFWIFFLVSM